MSLKFTRNVGIALFACFVSTGVASAQQVIGIDFYNSFNEPYPTNSGSGGTRPDSPQPRRTWLDPMRLAGWYNTYDVQNMPSQYPAGTNPYDNGGMGTGSGALLVDNSGLPTTATFGMLSAFNSLDGSSVYAPYYGAIGSNNASLTPNQQLYNGTTSSQGKQQQVSLLNVPYLTYNVYLMVNSDGAAGNGSVTLFTDAGSTSTATQGATYYFSSNSEAGTPIPGSSFSFVQATSTDPSNPTLNANYVEFTGLTSADVAFDVDSVNQSYNDGAFLGGIEIVDASSGAVPEPSTYAMLLAGLGFLALKMRRKLVK